MENITIQQLLGIFNSEKGQLDQKSQAFGVASQLLKGMLSLNDQRVTTLSEQVTSLNSQIATLNETITTLQTQVDAQKPVEVKEQTITNEPIPEVAMPSEVPAQTE